MRADDSVVMIIWNATPARGDKFEEAWRAPSEAAIDFGATYWALLRSKEDKLSFVQLAAFGSKREFERYWYSEEISEARAEASGLYTVPVLPVWMRAVDAGELTADSIEAPAQK